MEAQLAETKGIVGYCLRAQFMQRSFWTLSVWESEEALQAFVYEGFHAGVMSVLMLDMASPNKAQVSAKEARSKRNPLVHAKLV